MTETTSGYSPETSESEPVLSAAAEALLADFTNLASERRLPAGAFARLVAKAFHSGEITRSDLLLLLPPVEEETTDRPSGLQAWGARTAEKNSQSGYVDARSQQLPVGDR